MGCEIQDKLTAMSEVPKTNRRWSTATRRSILALGAALLSAPFLYFAGALYFDQVAGQRLGGAIGKPAAAVDAIFSSYAKTRLTRSQLPLGVAQCCPPSSVSFARYRDPLNAGSVVVSFDEYDTAVGGAPEY